MKSLQASIILLFTLLSFPGLAKDIDVPDILYVSIDPYTDEIIVAWEASESENIAYTQVHYVIEKGSTKNLTELSGNQDDSIRFSLDTINDDIIKEDEISGAMKFTVFSYDVNDKDSESAAFCYHTTMYLSTSYLHCPDRVFLQWTPYSVGSQISITVNSYTVIGMNDTSETILQTVDGSVNSAELSLDEIGDYDCFYIKADFTGTTGDDYISKSNKACIEKDIIETPDYININYISVIDSVGMEMSVSIDSTSSISNYDLYYSYTKNGDFSPFDTVTLRQLQHNDTVFTITAGSNIVTYFKIYAYDDCGDLIDSSLTACNILLENNDDDPYTDRLSWNYYTGWEDGVESYEIYRSLDNEAYESIGTNLTLDNNYSDDITDLAEEHSEFCYYVEAVSDNAQYTSKSNTLCIDKVPTVYVPNTILPNSSNSENTVFKAVSSFLAPDGFLLEVYDRWGKCLFSSDDPDESWDATVNGSYVQQGTYIYKVEYKTPAGESKSKHGVINVIYQ